MRRDQIISDIIAERERQSAKWGGPHQWGHGDCSSPDVAGRVSAHPGAADLLRSAILTEEVGEVARAVLDGTPYLLRAELVQVAAVAVAWIEYLDAASDE